MSMTAKEQDIFVSAIEKITERLNQQLQRIVELEKRVAALETTDGRAEKAA